MREVPWARGRPLVGLLAERQALGADFYGEMARRRGDVVGLRIGPFETILLSDPDHVDHVLRICPQRYSKGELFTGLRALLGEGLFFSDGERWRRDRRLLQPSFRPGALAALVPIWQRCVADLCASLDAKARSGERVDLGDALSKLALDMNARSLFGASLSPQTRDQIGALVEELSDLLQRQMFSPLRALLPFVPLPSDRKIRRITAALDAITGDLVSARARGETSGDDLLSAILSARDPESGLPLSPRELRDQVMTFFLAGHETTASALSWSMLLLAQHPEAASAVRRELEGIDPAEMSAEQIGALRETSSVLKESLRLYPPGWTFARRALQEDVIGGYTIPKGADILVCPYAMHRDARSFPEPERFLPARFPLPPASRRAYLPFGSGPRACIGGQLASLQGVLSIAALTKRYALELQTPAPVAVSALVTLRPGPTEARLSLIEAGAQKE